MIRKYVFRIVSGPWGHDQDERHSHHGDGLPGAGGCHGTGTDVRRVSEHAQTFHFSDGQLQIFSSDGKALTFDPQE